MTEFLPLAAAALFAGTVSSVVGLAGGSLLLLGLLGVYPSEIALPIYALAWLGNDALRALAFRNKLDFSILVPFSAGSAVGVGLASLVYVPFSTPILLIFLGLIVLAATWIPTENAPAPTRREYAMLGALIGFCGVFAGISALLVAPFLLRAHLDKEAFIGTKAACQIVMRAGTVLVYFHHGFDAAPHSSLILTLLAASALGIFAGKHVLSLLERETMRRAVQTATTALACRLLYACIVG
ncbi:MAG: sulfite exporter TauE/SafE family protein [Elusimicrobia bacterium]|nr:sulfite exporter TauE/SafE family protein [Elusimicrobiota bacterium]